MVKVIFIKKNGEKIECFGEIGTSLMKLAKMNKIDIEATCGGNLSCSTCHLVIGNKWIKFLKEKTEEEEFLLDTVYNLEEGSRLSCQIILTKELDGIEVFEK